MKKALYILLALVVCVSMTLTVFAVNDVPAAEGTEFVISPGEGGRPCNHGHKVIEGKKDPSCTEYGHSGSEICKDCGEVIKPGKVIPKLEHKYDKDGVCTVCGSHYQPTTGDSNGILLWTSLMLLSAAGLVAVTAAYRKKV